MTANFVPSDMQELANAAEEQKQVPVTTRRLDDTSVISTQRASEALNLKGLQSTQLVGDKAKANGLEALQSEINSVGPDIPATPITVAPDLRQNKDLSPGMSMHIN